MNPRTHQAILPIEEIGTFNVEEDQFKETIASLEITEKLATINTRLSTMGPTPAVLAALTTILLDQNLTAKNKYKAATLLSATIDGMAQGAYETTARKFIGIKNAQHFRSESAVVSELFSLMDKRIDLEKLKLLKQNEQDIQVSLPQNLITKARLAFEMKLITEKQFKVIEKAHKLYLSTAKETGLSDEKKQKNNNMIIRECKKIFPSILDAKLDEKIHQLTFDILKIKDSQAFARYKKKTEKHYNKNKINMDILVELEKIKESIAEGMNGKYQKINDLKLSEQTLQILIKRLVKDKILPKADYHKMTADELKNILITKIFEEITNKLNSKPVLCKIAESIDRITYYTRLNRCLSEISKIKLTSSGSEEEANENYKLFQDLAKIIISRKLRDEYSGTHPSAQMFAKIFNEIIIYIKMSILSAPSHERLFLCEFFARVMQKSYEMHNYPYAIAIQKAFGDYLLRDYVGNLSKKAQRDLEHVRRFCSAEDNFKKYNEKLTKDKEKCYIPFLAVSGRALSMLTEIQKSEIESQCKSFLIRQRTLEEIFVLQQTVKTNSDKNNKPHAEILEHCDDLMQSKMAQEISTLANVIANDGEMGQDFDEFDIFTRHLNNEIENTCTPVSDEGVKSVHKAMQMVDRFTTPYKATIPDLAETEKHPKTLSKQSSSESCDTTISSVSPDENTPNLLGSEGVSHKIKKQVSSDGSVLGSVIEDDDKGFLSDSSDDSTKSKKLASSKSEVYSSKKMQQDLSTLRRTLSTRLLVNTNNKASDTGTEPTTPNKTTLSSPQGSQPPTRPVSVRLSPPNQRSSIEVVSNKPKTKEPINREGSFRHRLFNPNKKGKETVSPATPTIVIQTQKN